jgi:hypothetical protein
MSRKWLALCLFAACTTSCTTTDEPSTSAKVEPVVKKPKPSAWKEIETPYPVGKKLPCATLVAADKIGETLGKKLEVIDESSKDLDATSVCRLMLAKPQPGKAASGPGKSLAPGEELATVTALCWSSFTVPDVKKKCGDGGEDISTDVGMLTCVRKVPAGDNTRFIVTTLEPDTRCKLVVNPGPANYDLALTKATAQALVDTIDKDTLKVAAPK